jgi:hypothetical protein
MDVTLIVRYDDRESLTSDAAEITLTRPPATNLGHPLHRSLTGNQHLSIA